MIELEFLTEVRDYIEASEKTLEEEFGSGRSLEQVIEDGHMPDVYEKVLRRIAAMGEGENEL